MNASARMKHLAGILILTVTIGPWARAQDNENWYQVEMLVFKRTSMPGETEAWPKNIALAYPPNIQHLIDPNNAQADTLSPLDTQDMDADTAVDSTNAELSASPSPDQDTLKANEEQPFTLLPEDRFFIRGADYAIRKERGLTTLFHASWAQKMVALENAPAIIIRGGEAFGGHRELEGTITLSVSRYLHLHTDLWLAEYEANYGQADYHWPKLPQPPEPQLQSDELAGTPLPVTNTFPLSTTAADPFKINLNTGAGANPSPSLSGVQTLDETLSSLANEPYLVKHIVLLDQKRRMRSEELHYIDHPRLGILIKIIPYTPAHLQVEENPNA